MKKSKEEWWSGKGAMKGAGKGRRQRNTHEMLPNMALEKHAWLGAGLMWKRMLATTTGTRKAQRTEGGERDQTPFKALPLVPVWDELFVATNHSEFHKHHGESVLTETSSLTRVELDQIDPNMEWHGDQGDGPPVFAFSTKRASSRSDKHSRRHRKGHGTPWYCLFSWRSVRPSCHAGMCGEGA